MAEYPDIKRRVTSITNPNYDISIELKQNRSRSTDEITEELRQKLAFIPGVSVKFDDNERSSDMVSFVIGAAGKTLREIRESSGLLTNALYQNSDIVDSVLSNKQADTDKIGGAARIGRPSNKKPNADEPVQRHVLQL